MEKMKIIALMGKAKAGKDTAGGMLAEMGGGATMAFADKLKQYVGEMFGLSHDDMYTDEGKAKPTRFDCLMCPECHSLECEAFETDRMKRASCKLCGSVGDLTVFKSKWTPRTILQHIGTEGFRRINPDVWVDFALEYAKYQLETYPFVVITDCRFRSECMGVWANGGEVWRLRRRETDTKAEGIGGHASETEMDGISDNECQAVVHNDSTLGALRALLHVQFERFNGASAAA